MTKTLTTRPPLRRVNQIHFHLSRGNPVNASSLSRELEVSPKTIRRDIAFMRDEWNLPIAWDAQENSYYYTGEVSGLPSVQVTEGEVLALFVAQRALASYAGTPFETPLKTAFEKLSESMKTSFSVSLESLSKAISFVPLKMGKTDLATFEIVTRALNERRELTFDYRKLAAPRPESRRVRPYHLASIESQWYLFAYDLKRKAVRTFVLGRIEGTPHLGEPFTMPDDFDLKSHLLSGFGLFTGEGDYRVRIEFSSTVARLIRERTWHSTQEIRELPDGKIELRMKLGSLEDVSRWVLEWGGHARVVGPRELRDKVSEALRAAQAHYRCEEEFSVLREEIIHYGHEAALEHILHLVDDPNQMELRLKA